MSKKQNRTFTALRRSIGFLICLMFMLSLSLPAAGADETAKTGLSDTRFDVDIWEGGGYSAVLYNNLNGLPTSETNDIVETKEGFIWIGTYSGLIRYDGNTFEHLDPSAGIPSVMCLYVDHLDRLWIGTNESGVICMQHGKFYRWDVADGLPSSAVRGILEDQEGTIYLGTTAGMALISPEMELQPMDAAELQGAFIQDLDIDSEGLVYGLTNQGDVFTAKDGKLVRYYDHAESHVKGASCIYPDPDNPGYVYMENEDEGIFYGNPSDNFRNMRSLDIWPLSQVQEFKKIDGQVWICARNGVGVVDYNGFHFLDNIPMDNAVGHVIKDYQGNLWFTSSHQGVMKIVRNQFTDLFQRANLLDTVVNSTCMLDDMLFIGSDSGLDVIRDDQRVFDIPLTKAQTASGTEIPTTNLLDMLEGCRIRSVIRDSRNRLWISTWRKYGLLCYDYGELTAYTTDDGLFSDHVRAVREREDGSILVANTGGVNVIRDGKVTESYSEVDGIANTETLTVEEGENGDILIGSDGGGIYILGKEGTRHIGKSEGLTSEAVMRIKKDPEHLVYWVVTGSSIAYLTQDYQIHTIEQFPYSNNFDLYENNKGEMWVLGSSGIHVASIEELLANEEIHTTYYGMSNGLPCIATANSYSELTEEGDLYIAGSTGVARVNINDFHENINDLKMTVPYMDAEDTRIYPDETGTFDVPSKVRRLTIYAYVFNYSLNDPQIAYQLEGFDRDRIIVSRSNLDPIIYTNLPGGNYRFVMQLQDLIGGESKTLEIPFTKKKALYERVWFYVVCGLVVMFAVLLLIRSYFRKKIRQLEAKHQEEAEKQRIGTELQMARRIQNSMLPHEFPPFPDRHEFDIYATMDPAREVGGDFYDYFLVDDDHLCIVIADVSGKGIPAALFMMISKVILQSCAMLGVKPGEILGKTNEALCTGNQVEMFVTVWLGILEISTGKIVAANAGHEYPALMQDGKFALLKDKHGFVIGGMDGIKYTEYEIRLEPGNKLFLYTDGVPESTDPQEKMFGTDRMIEALNAEPEETPEQILRNVRSAVDSFVMEAEQFDDLTMLCLEYKGKTEDPDKDDTEEAE